MKIAVLKEQAADEQRVSATPETVKKFIGLGATLAVEQGAGESASIADADNAAAGATVGGGAVVWKTANIILGFKGPWWDDFPALGPVALWAANIIPLCARPRVEIYAAPGLQASAFECMPPTT